jgi:hypothetical protein
MSELYIYPVELRKCHGQIVAIQISTKSVNNHVEKHPLDMREARNNAAFNNLLIARAINDALKIKGLRSQVAHNSNIFARYPEEISVYKQIVGSRSGGRGAPAFRLSQHPLDDGGGDVPRAQEFDRRNGAFACLQGDAVVDDVAALHILALGKGKLFHRRSRP